MNLRTLVPTITILFLGSASQAQMMNTVPADLAVLGELREKSRTHATSDGHNYQLVDDHLRPTNGQNGSFLRTSWRSEGRYHVRIVDANGSLRMTGTYLDETLEVADGTFEFFHSDGQLESTGTFEEGRKTGLWRRFSKNGQELAQRIYGTSEPEAVLVSAGWASKASTLTSR